MICRKYVYIYTKPWFILFYSLFEWM
jgi:hypothetical protein